MVDLSKHLVKPGLYSHLSNKRGVTLIDFEKKNPPSTQKFPILVYCFLKFLPISSFIPASSPLFHSLHCSQLDSFYLKLIFFKTLVPFSLGKCSWQNIYYYIGSFLASLLVYKIGFPPPRLLKFSKNSNLLRVSVQGVESLWGDCRFIPADWGVIVVDLYYFALFEDFSL